MALQSRIARGVGRTAAISLVGRFARRYPIVSVTLIIWRWWRRRTTNAERSVVRLRRSESIVVTDRVD